MYIHIAYLVFRPDVCAAVLLLACAELSDASAPRVAAAESGRKLPTRVEPDRTQPSSSPAQRAPDRRGPGESLRGEVTEDRPASNGRSAGSAKLGSLAGIYGVYGIDFSPCLNGQSPNLGAQISDSQIASRMQIVAPYTNWVRSFSSTHGLENIPFIARQFGLCAFR